MKRPYWTLININLSLESDQYLALQELASWAFINTNKMKKRTPVSKIMTSHPISINLTNNVRDAVQIFQDNKIHHLPVVSGDKLIGIISKTDIERISYFSGVQNGEAQTVVYDMLDIEQVMTKQIETIKSEDQIRDAAELLAQGEYHALPVVEDGKLTGIVTTTDVLKFMLDQF